MCQSPLLLPNGQTIACRKCKLCRFNRVKDWAGRNIAQSKVSTASFACDLTYGPELDQSRMPIPGAKDHIRTAVLTYSDVQKCLKYLRWLGYEFDYFITGENGSLKGRAHWHIIFHFKGKVPTHEIGINFSDRHKNEFGKLYDHEVCKAWPHGFMFWKKAHYEDVFYNCKYILKDEDDENSQRKPGMSKKPPLGYEYFCKVAESAVAQGIAPQTLEYRFPEIRQKKNKQPILFYLQGRSAELYLDHFIQMWARERPNQQRPRSDLVDLYEEYGQVVHDENALLIRREFPKGESRDAIPSGERIKAVAKEALAELAEWEEARERDEYDEWWTKFVRKAKNEQERQRREELREHFEQQRGQQGYAKLQAFYDQQHAKGLRFDGVEWEWLPDPEFRPDLLPSSAGSGEPSPPGRRGVVIDPDAVGKVGRWNRVYGDAVQSIGNAGSGGPGKAS